MDLDLGNTWKQRRRAFKQAPFLLCAHFVNIVFLYTNIEKTKINKLHYRIQSLSFLQVLTETAADVDVEVYAVVAVVH